jgi:integrase/recombinase XerD
MEEQVLAFLDYLEKEYHYSENTIAAYKNDLSQFLDFVQRERGAGLDAWSDISEANLQNYLHHMRYGRSNAYATSTIARKVAAIKSFFNYLFHNRLISENPAREIDSPKVKKRLPQTLTFHDVDKLLQAPANDRSPKNLRDMALLNVLYSTGMRVTEVVSLQLDDVNLAESYLQPAGRQGGLRQIPFDEQTHDSLASYISAGRPHLVKAEEEQALFLNHRGQQLTRQGLWLIIKGYAQEAGLEAEVTPHTLRHSFAVHKLSKGSKLEEVQKLLGHANISTTQIYTQLETETPSTAGNNAGNEQLERGARIEELAGS